MIYCCPTATPQSRGVVGSDALLLHVNTSALVSRCGARETLWLLVTVSGCFAKRLGDGRRTWVASGRNLD